MYKRVGRISSALMLAMSLAGLYSCGNKEGPPQTETEILSVTPRYPEALPAGGGILEFTITSGDGKWDYTVENGEWLSEKSKTTTALTLEVAANVSSGERKATLTFSEQSSSILRQVKVTQSGLVIAAEADVFDVMFTSDGMAKDISAMGNDVTTVSGAAMSTLYNNTYKRYAARFNHTPSGTASAGYFRVDYETNQTFRDKLADGHTLEAIFMLDVDSPLPNSEIKMFSSHQSGGTGILIGNSSRGNSIIFLPHVGGSYLFTNSGVVPQRNMYYHVVGVWDKEAGKTSVYVNGELKGQESVSGDLKFPSSGSNWFCIGADPSGASANTAWKGDVVTARIYDKALGADEVAKLWEKVSELKPDPDGIQITGVALMPRNVQAKSQYVIEGSGFAAGDKIKMIPISGVGAEFVCDCTADAGSLSVTIPDNFTTGTYRLLVVRGSKTFDLGFTTLTLRVNDKLPQVIAHRGYWKSGAPQNSVASLAKAQELKVFGSEFDVWVTTDGQVVLNHDNSINNIRIENATYDQIKDIRLSNGDPISTLGDCLEQARKNTSVKLIIELKTHSYSQGGVSNNMRVAQAVYDMVKAAGMADQVEYIAFSLDICKRLVELDSNAIVGYLNGDLAPKTLYDMGIKCIDYSMANIRKQVGWIAEAQQLGMFVNVWTVNSESDIQEMINYGVDYISSDYPELAIELIEKNR